MLPTVCGSENFLDCLNALIEGMRISRENFGKGGGNMTHHTSHHLSESFAIAVEASYDHMRQHNHTHTQPRMTTDAWSERLLVELSHVGQIGGKSEQ